VKQQVPLLHPPWQRPALLPAAAVMACPCPWQQQRSRRCCNRRTAAVAAAAGRPNLHWPPPTGTTPAPCTHPPLPCCCTLPNHPPDGLHCPTHPPGPLNSDPLTVDIPVCWTPHTLICRVPVCWTLHTLPVQFPYGPGHNQEGGHHRHWLLPSHHQQQQEEEEEDGPDPWSRHNQGVRRCCHNSHRARCWCRTPRVPPRPSCHPCCLHTRPCHCCHSRPPCRCCHSHSRPRCCSPRCRQQRCTPGRHHRGRTRRARRARHGPPRCCCHGPCRYPLAAGNHPSAVSSCCQL
jgi:hypothetical protein